MNTQKRRAVIGPVTVRLDGGRRFEFDRLASAIAWTGSGWRSYDDALPFADDVRRERMAAGGRLRPYRWRETTSILFLDELGLRIPGWKVAEAAHAIEGRGPYLPRCRRGYDPSTFRLTPVPFTGRSGRGRCFRAMRTTQERRKYVEVRGDGEYLELGGRLRARRSAANLVDAWDDVQRGRSRSWKDSRITQWRG